MRAQLKQNFIIMLIASFTMLGFTQTVQAAMISTAQVAAGMSNEQLRAHVVSSLERPELQSRLHALGISQADAQMRVAALTDAEVSALGSRIDSLPAGGDGGIIEALIFVFIVLLITDILGFTSVFPFTHKINR